MSMTNLYILTNLSINSNVLDNRDVQVMKEADDDAFAGRGADPVVEGLEAEMHTGEVSGVKQDPLRKIFQKIDYFKLK